MAPIILRKFNMNYIDYNDIILIIGLQKSGKSYITKDLLYYHNDIITGAVIVNSYCNKKIYDYIPPLFIHESYNDTFIKKIVKKQLKIEHELYDSRFFIIFEDCIKYKDAKKSKYLRKILCNPEKINGLCILEIIELDELYKILLLKKKINYLFLTKDTLENNRKKIYDAIKDIIMIEFSLFCKFLDDYTDNYNCLVIDVHINSNVIEDKLYWYNASNHENFKVCSNESWIYSEYNLIKESEKKDYNNNLFLRSINYF